MNNKSPVFTEYGYCGEKLRTTGCEIIDMPGYRRSPLLKRAKGDDWYPEKFGEAPRTKGRCVFESKPAAYLKRYLDELEMQTDGYKNL